MKDEVDFLPADKHKSFPHDSITLDVRGQACPKYPKQQVYNSLQYVKENVKDEVDFLLAGKPRRFLQRDTIIWDSKISCISQMI